MSQTTSTTQAVASVISVTSGDLKMIVWEDGHLSIEHWEYSYSGNAELDHCRISPEQFRAFHTFIETYMLEKMMLVPS